ncbi:MAG: bifunctional (p)ppGpp synthetase/guanosine-3',5'-bis(diphosphate) 3'-pyrophosphohydrolase [Endomicrobiales bacterium]|nr:bifunctional (p)ppGpp synthetase/guanosine-3',5'-bis(diphosphate) 3'-pyrophosphohydrolase [Endomicrobiales bacterium]
MLSELTAQIKSYLPEEDLKPVEKAFIYARNAHGGQRRFSGEPYFSHCFEVAKILTELKLDVPTVAAALLHDVLEDTQTKKDDLEAEFGKEITSMVEGVTKIGSYNFSDQETAQAENWRKMLLAITKDIRVILVKLADRIHNMRTASALPEEKRKKMATESLNLYAPFAQRLGIYRWKNELEDMAFGILDPRGCEDLRGQWEKRQESSVKSLEKWKKAINEKLAGSGIRYRISARPKSLYGIHRKMARQKKGFSEIQDLIGLRLITDSVENCYALLGLLNDGFTPLEGSFTDYINLPKMNMYQSLHLSLRDDAGTIAEIQIRTEEMHRRSEYGIAAHWRYKESVGITGAGIAAAGEIEDKLDWLKKVLEWQQELKDPKEFLESLKVECEFEQVFVYTPKGRVIKLPKDSTPVDFAYAVHSEIGDRCYGAKIGKKLVPLDYRLRSGEMCQILTRKSARPTKDWLEFVITPRARSKIRKSLRESGGES